MSDKRTYWLCERCRATGVLPEDENKWPGQTPWERARLMHSSAYIECRDARYWIRAGAVPDPPSLSPLPAPATGDQA